MEISVPDLLLQLLKPEVILLFWLILARVSGLFLTAPGFNWAYFPTTVRIWLALGLTLILATSIFQWPFATLPDVGITDIWGLMIWTFWEFAIGWVLGTATQWMIESIRVSGEMLSTQMGLSLATSLDPSSGQANTVLAQSFTLMALLLFLTLNLHHILVIGLAKTFTWLPVGQWPDLSAWVGPGVDHLITWFGEAFSIGLVIATPIIGLLFLTEVALSFVAKLMPQMNIFVVGLPVKLMMGLIGVSLSMPKMLERLQIHWNGNFEDLFQLFKGLL